MTLHRLSHLLVGLMACSGCAVQPTQHGIPNFGITGGVAHGGNPTDEGWKWLRDNGWTNAVNLAPECDDTPALLASLEVQDIPITTWQQIFGRVKPQVKAASALIGPHTYLHCKRGANRTMTVMGDYLINHGWPRPDTQEMMDTHGWRDSFPALRWFWWFDKAPKQGAH